MVGLSSRRGDLPPEAGRSLEDRNWIYLGKVTRAVAYGAASGFLFLYLEQSLGFSAFESLVVTSLTLVGAAVGSLVVLPIVVTRFGPRRATWLFAGLFVVSALMLFLSALVPVVVAAVLLGGVGAQTGDNGPLASLDQALLPSILRPSERTRGFAWYNLTANFASAGGAALLLVPGALAPLNIPWLPAGPHPWLLLVYLLLAGTTVACYRQLSERVDRAAETTGVPDAPISTEVQGHVRTLAGLFALDSFAGGLVINPVITAFFVLAWHQSVTGVGEVLSLAGVVSGLSLLLAASLARRIGLLPTMVFTHLPSQLFLVLVPLMPTFPLALGVYLARTSLSQMDVPTRQAYTMNLVPGPARARVAGTLSGARGVPQSVGPLVASAFLDTLNAVTLAFFFGGGLKAIYDVLLWIRFRRVRVPVTETG